MLIRDPRAPGSKGSVGDVSQDVHHRNQMPEGMLMHMCMPQSVKACVVSGLEDRSAGTALDARTPVALAPPGPSSGRVSGALLRRARITGQRRRQGSHVTRACLSYLRILGVHNYDFSYR